MTFFEGWLVARQCLFNLLQWMGPCSHLEKRKVGSWACPQRSWPIIKCLNRWPVSLIKWYRYPVEEGTLWRLQVWEHILLCCFVFLLCEDWMLCMSGNAEHEVHSFGLGQFGQLGHGTFIFESRLPRVVEHFRRGRVKHVECGENHTALITGKTCTENHLITFFVLQYIWYGIISFKTYASSICL